MVYYVGTGLICSPILAKHMALYVSWLDHVVCTFDDITFGDHIPVRIVYYFKQGDHVKKSHSNDEVENSVPRVNWGSASDAQILECKKLTNLLLGRIDMNKDAFTSCELNCNNVEHQHEIDWAYSNNPCIA